MLTDRGSPSQLSLLAFARTLTTEPPTTITHTHAHTNVAAPVPLLTSCISKNCTELAPADAATTTIAADHILTAAPPPPNPPPRTHSNPSLPPAHSSRRPLTLSSRLLSDILLIQTPHSSRCAATSIASNSTPKPSALFMQTIHPLSRSMFLCT